MQVDRDDVRDPAGDGIAAGKTAAVARAIACCHDPFGIGNRIIGAPQGLAHVLGDGSGHHQHIGMARRGHEAQAEPLDVIIRVVEGMNLELAAIAGAGIELINPGIASPAGGRGVRLREPVAKTKAKTAKQPRPSSTRSLERAR